MNWQPNIMRQGTKPLYIALADTLEEDIQSGILSPGDQLPPQRELADQLGMNLSTVARAFKLCELKGLISGVVGRGTFVAADVKVSLSLIHQTPHSNLIEMGQVLPLYHLDGETAKATKNMLADMDVQRLLRYSEPEGLLSHRVIGAEWLKRFNIKASPEEILITPGSQNALATCFLTLFQHGDRVAVDALTYPGIKSLANLHGIRLVPIELTREGMSPQGLNDACKNEGIKGIYLMPEVHNPTTLSMTPSCREQIAGIIQKHHLILMEDDAYAHTGNGSSIPITQLVPEHGIYMGGTAKILGPGFRISFVKAPQDYLGTLKKGLLNTAWMASPITAELVTRLISEGKAELILKSKREEAKKRNELALKILASYKILSRPYGFFQWLYLPEGWQSSVFEMMAREAGVQVFCAEKFAVGSGQVSPAVRLSVSGPDTIEALEKGLGVLKKILEGGYEGQNPSMIY